MDLQKILDEQRKLAEESGLRKSDAVINRTIANREKARDPEWQKSNAARLEKMHSDPEFKKNQVERLKALHSDPNWIESTKAALQKVHSDPNWIESQKRAGEKRAKDPEWQKSNAARLEKMHSDPEFKKNQVERLKALHSDPLWKEKQKTVLNKMHSSSNWKKATCRPIKTPYGIFENSKEVTAIVQKENGWSSSHSGCMVRKYLKDDSNIQWQYLTWEDYENLTNLP